MTVGTTTLIAAVWAGAAAGVESARPDQGHLDAIRASKRATAIRVAEPIRVDGILDEPAWNGAQPASQFYQQQPAEFTLATHRTEVRFLYDDTTLYVGALLLDQPPGGLITNDLKRDFGARDTDSFGVIIDTFRDRRNSYGFLINPGGAIRDTLASDSGRRNDPSWHAAWRSQAAIRPDGWCVEFAIPFKALRFPATDAQEWGLNLVRIVRGANEIATWSPVPRQFSHYAVAYAGTLSGIRNVGGGRNLQVKPFATAKAGRDLPEKAGSSADADGGVDLKWGISPSLLLDATYRTDFSQVEADEQQINLTRFTTFFPEKREFFLENPASFQIGIYEPDNQAPRRDLVPFFSRRIGLSSTGQPIPVIGGARITGRAGSQSLGFLNMQTQAFDGRPGDNFTAARVSRALSSKMSLGAFYFGREATGSADFNRVGGLDLRVTPVRTLEIEAFAMHSSTFGVAGGWAGRAGFRFDSSHHRARVGLVHVADQFRHALGYTRRRGIATLFGNYALVVKPRNTDGVVREYSVGPEFEITGDDKYSQLLTGIGGLKFGMLFADGGNLKVWGERTTEKLATPFPIGTSSLTIRPGEYGFGEFGASYISNRSATLSGSLETSAGSFWTGWQRSVNAGLRVRFNSHVAASATLGRSVVHLPEGSYTADLVGVRLDWSFTPRMFLNAFLQYNSETNTWLSNVRFNLVHRPLSDIYVVWNETRLPTVTRRVLMFKYTHMLAF